MSEVEQVTHATSLVAFLLNRKSYDNVTGVMRMGISPFHLSEDTIHIQLNGESYSVKYFLKGKYATLIKPF